MIRPVTFYGASNFKANLYALEVKSRFLIQSKADGYYQGYGDEINAVASGNTVTIKSGALLIQGRLNEIEGSEIVTVAATNGQVGYIIARIETYRPDDTNNCTITARVGSTLSSITLTQQDTYQRAAESQNKIYELPLYSFNYTNGTVTNLVKLIEPIQARSGIADLTYPVGAIYMSVSPTSPASLFGGTWASWGAGRVPVGVNASNSAFNSVELTGGEQSHTLSQNEMPTHNHAITTTMEYAGSHTHEIQASQFKIENDFGGSDHWVNVDYSIYDTSGNNCVQNTVTRVWNCNSAGSHKHGISSTAGNAGGGASHNNLQPYITCYMWKRIA